MSDFILSVPHGTGCSSETEGVLDCGLLFNILGGTFHWGNSGSLFLSVGVGMEEEAEQILREWLSNFLF